MIIESGNELVFRPHPHTRWWGLWMAAREWLGAPRFVWVCFTCSGKQSDCLSVHRCVECGRKTYNGAWARLTSGHREEAMSYIHQHSAKILCDSISPEGVRLTTMEVVVPRIVLAEFNTHRVFSRNSASSRAIPVEKMLARVKEHPYIPGEWGKNRRGMQAGEDLDERDGSKATDVWLRARDHAVAQAERMLDLGIHKQLTNRLLEPWLWHTILVSATEWDNFFHLRCHPDAHPDIRKTAELMRAAMGSSKPTKRDHGEWHLPLMLAEDFGSRTTDEEIAVSVGRCARVSYLTHDGRRDLQADIELHDRLLQSGHMSPFEHVARPMTKDDVYGILEEQSGVCGIRDFDLDVSEHFVGNFRGWVQYRKTIPSEHDIKRMP